MNRVVKIFDTNPSLTKNLNIVQKIHKFVTETNSNSTIVWSFVFNILLREMAFLFLDIKLVTIEFFTTSVAVLKVI